MLKTVKSRDGAVLVPMSADEMAGLIEVSAGRVVSARFGTGGSALIAADAGWALPLLAEWRSAAFSAGAGI